MRDWISAAALALFVVIGGGACLPTARAASVTPSDWAAYKAAFVGPQGRVIDTGNGKISHSEGQGYGLLLAYLANDQAGFDLIWSFTQTEFLLRDDGLAVWRWDPNATPHVTDPNNATDGDILIAYALALAGRNWKRGDLLKAATGMASSIGELVKAHQEQTILLPGETGYGAADREDGPVVNLSYWVFEALPVLAEIAPGVDWESLSTSGMALLDKAQFGPRKLPPDWLSLHTRPKPADGFPDEFGYNAVRIPLYLARADVTDRGLLSRFRDGMTDESGQVGIVDLDSGAITQTLTDPGYAILPAILSCILDKQTVAAEIRSFTPTLYYPSTLHLLGLSFLSEKHPECLR